MIINPEIFGNKFFYKCNKLVADYLIYELHIPLLSVNGNIYYFADNELLKESLNKLPLFLKFINLFINK